MWNSCSHQLLGLAMTPDDLYSLNDIYKILKDPDTNKQTSYVLQFLWRDLTSNYDIVGPYFTCSSSVESKFVIACVLETIKLFQFHGLKMSLLVWRTCKYHCNQSQSWTSWCVLCNKWQRQIQSGTVDDKSLQSSSQDLLVDLSFSSVSFKALCI